MQSTFHVSDKVCKKSGATWKLPAGKILIPGVVSHATDLVEHPELVTDRVVACDEVVGRENVIAGTGCGRVIRKSHGQAARSAGGDREQEVVELNSKPPVRDERKKARKSKSKSLTLS